jgi:hypothetical protein
MRRSPWAPLVAFAAIFGLGLACHSQPEHVGQPCDVVDDCYPDLKDRDALAGEIECLTKVPGGYCTHLCESDDDCCAVPGECVGDYPQVCAPFEDQPDKRCFLSCEGDLRGYSPDDYCRTYAHPDFNCRSTGGGAQNRKVCVP